MSESEEVRQHREENMHGEIDDQIISGGWSVTVGYLKKALANVPDDYEIMLTNAEVDDCEISNLDIDMLYPPALGSPGLLIFHGGQIVNSEYAFHSRMDAHHTLGGDLRWSEEKGWYEL